YPGLVHPGHVHQNLRESGHHRSEVAQRTTSAGQACGQLQAGEDAVASGGVLGEDDVTGLLPAEAVAAGAHRFQHVPVPHPGLHDLDPGLLHRQGQAEIAHHRDHEGASGELAGLVQSDGEDAHDLITVDECSSAVHRQATVGVPVVGDPEVGPGGHGDGLELFWMGGAALLVDVAPVRGGVDHHHVGTGRAQGCRAHLAGGAVGAVDGDAQPAEVGLDGAEQVLDVPVPGLTAVHRDRADVRADGQLPAAVQVRLDLVLDGIVELDSAAGEEL